MLALNIQGRVMLLLSRLGIREPHALAIYCSAVSAAVLRLRDGASVGENASVEAILDQQISLLEIALNKKAVGGLAPAPITDARYADEAASSVDSTTDVPSAKIDRPRRRARNLNQGAEPFVRSLEEKLKEDRKPVQKLIADECVVAGLVDTEQAKKLIAGMTGKVPQDAEREIAEYLREVLLQQVKHCIRKIKGGPWSSPRVQADLRNDIHNATTVRGVLMLSRQILKERQTWEKENGRTGILGLFASRH